MNEFDDWLDRELGAPEDSIDDAGFSESVMRRLPPRKPRFSVLRRLILSCAMILGSLLTVLLATPLELLPGMEGFPFVPQSLLLSSLLFSAAVSISFAWLMTGD